MKRIRKIDKYNLMATFEAGVRGSDAENAVAREGMTIGHYPQSIELSTVGGWVATRSSGQFSSAYGSIEDVVMGLEVVLPNGDVLETRLTPRAAAGPDLNHIFLGSEGTLGIVTAVIFSCAGKRKSRDTVLFMCRTWNRDLKSSGISFNRAGRPP